MSSYSNENFKILESHIVYFQGLLYTRVCNISDPQVMAMGNEIQDEFNSGGRKNTKYGDMTSSPFLTLIVSAGILRDLAEGIIAYGLKPVLSLNERILNARK